MQKFEKQMGIRSIGSGDTLPMLFLLFMFMTHAGYVSANNTLTQLQQLSVGQTLISPSQTFELGFFIRANSSKQYLGIWYKNMFVHKVVWVANRKNPLLATDSGSSLIIGKDGNLRLLDGTRNPVWWTNVSVQSNISVAVLSDNGDWILKDNVSNFVLWESFNYPSDTFLPGMNIGINTESGEQHCVSSWNTIYDPSPGKFVAGLTSERPPQAFIWNGSMPYWRSGPWDGGKFIGIPDSDDGYASNFRILPNNYLTITTFNKTYVLIMVLTPAGSLQTLIHDRDIDEMYLNWVAPENPCDVYGVCGPFGVCNKIMSSICSCLKGFVPKSIAEWRQGNWGGGCVRRTELLCQRNLDSSARKEDTSDGFLELKGVKLPDHYEYLIDVPNSLFCEQRCRSNCSCQAYVYLPRIGCMVWARDLIDIQQFPYLGDNLILHLAHSELDKDEKKVKFVISFGTISAVILLGITIYGLYKCALRRILKRQTTSIEVCRENVPEDHTIHEDSSELPVFEFHKILLATDNFNRANKLGEGGFGEVYKGKLENGQDVAVKRLSTRSGQGDREFKNELILISKLQHRNLVRLLGCCIEGEEKLLVYKYMTNRSLDTFLFDAKKRTQLDWATRFRIIRGTARGLLYLHRDSRLRVIHRDMKASNILLDDDMNAKISDFGLARTFQGTQDLANTQRVVGTFGYMSPEYAIGGLFSEKSDVFSFGVLLLEIISGMKNTSFHNQGKHVHLLGYAWQLWEEKRGLDLLDQALADSYAPKDVLICIQIGLLCVQDHAADRPTMSAVVVMLSSEIEIPQPKKPIFTFQSLMEPDPQSHSAEKYSQNELTTTIVEGR